MKKRQKQIILSYQKTIKTHNILYNKVLHDVKVRFDFLRYIVYTKINMPATPLAFGNAYLWQAFLFSQGD